MFRASAAIISRVTLQSSCMVLTASGNRCVLTSTRSPNCSRNQNCSSCCKSAYHSFPSPSLAHSMEALRALMSPERTKSRSDGAQSDGMDDATAVVEVPKNEPPQWAQEYVDINQIIRGTNEHGSTGRGQQQRRPKTIPTNWRPG